MHWGPPSNSPEPDDSRHGTGSSVWGQESNIQGLGFRVPHRPILPSLPTQRSLGGALTGGLVHGVLSSLLGLIVPSFRALSEGLEFTVRRHKSNEDSLSERGSDWRVGRRCACGPGYYSLQSSQVWGFSVASPRWTELEAGRADAYGLRSDLRFGPQAQRRERAHEIRTRQEGVTLSSQNRSIATPWTMARRLLLSRYPCFSPPEITAHLPGFAPKLSQRASERERECVCV